MNSSIQQIDSVLTEKLSPLVRKLKTRIERTLQGSMTPNAETCFAVRRLNSKLELRCLAVISNYLDEGYGELLEMDILCNKQKMGLCSQKESEILFILFRDKESCLRMLQKLYSDRDFYGNFLKRVEKILRELQFLTLNPRRPQRKIRHRGYRDHGSCRPQSRWLPNSDYSFTEKQNQIEEENSFKIEVQSKISNYGLLGVRLPELEI